MNHLELLQRLHDELRPAGYLQIGVEWGDTLQISRARSVAIEPDPKFRPESLLGKPRLVLFVGSADDFFREHQRESMLGDAPLDLALIDGLHRFTQVVRDLENIERWAHADTVVAIHDVLPRSPWEAAQQPHDGFWTGDVWRIVPFLRQYRPDLRLLLTAAEPTGMLFVTGLDPNHSGMGDLAAEQDKDFPLPGPAYDRLVEAFIASTNPMPAEDALRALGLSRRLERDWDYVTKWGMRLVADASWKPLLEAAEALPDTPQHHAGMRASLRLIGAFWLPEGVRERAYWSLGRYAREVSALWPSTTSRILTLPGAASRTLTTPGPVVADDTLLAAVQEMSGNGEQTPVWRLLRLGDDLAVVGAEPLRNETLVGDSVGIASFDRLMPFADARGVQACVTLAGDSSRISARSGLVTIADGVCRNLILLGDGQAHQPDRILAPLATDDGIRFVACWEPIEVWGIEAGAERATRVALLPAPRLAERFGHATAGVAVPDGHVFLVNEDASVKGAESVCYARFVLMRTDFRVIAVSPEFWVAARGEDHASGLARRGHELFAGFTSRNRQAVVTRIPLEDVLDSLISVDSPGLTSSG